MLFPLLLRLSFFSQLITWITTLAFALLLAPLHLSNNHRVLAIPLQQSSSSSVPVEVQTKQGQLRGTESTIRILGRDERVRSFLGVPYALPPVNELRFRPPVANPGWSGVRDALLLPPTCHQLQYNGTFWGEVMWAPNTPMDEDCLYINLWTPANGGRDDVKNLPVMVWIYGGGFVTGSASLSLYDGSTLAVMGNVVVVSMNYRVGAFGYLYLDHEEVPGNMGALDQQLALRWVRDNIEVFGGNPKAVTLFGQSAGAASVAAHMIAPDSRGLFTNAILMSGALDNMWAMDNPRAMAKSMRYAEVADCTNTAQIDELIRCLRNTPAVVLRDRIGAIPNVTFFEFSTAMVSRDRNFFRKRDALFALREREFSRDINLMIGSVRDEGNLFLTNFSSYFNFSDEQQPRLLLAEFEYIVNKAFERLPTTIRAAASHVYLGGNTCNEERYAPAVRLYILSRQLAEQANQMVGDYFLACDGLWLADAASDGPGRVYVYYFDQRSSDNPWPRWMGVMHGYELEYVFGVPLHNTTAKYTVGERILSQKLVQYWTSFAANGTPTLATTTSGEGAADEDEEWPQYRSGSAAPENDRKWMYLSGSRASLRTMKPLKTEECKVWRTAKDLQYYQEYMLAQLTEATPSSSSVVAAAWKPMISFSIALILLPIFFIH